MCSHVPGGCDRGVQIEVEGGNKMEKKFMKGNEAIAEAAVRAGCGFAGYPITPQSEIPEYLSRRLPEVGGFCTGRVK